MSTNFSKPTSKKGEIGHFNVQSYFENQLQCTAEFVSKALKDVAFVLIVFKTKKYVLYSY